MIKAELVTKISEKSGLTKKDTNVFIDAFTDSVKEALKEGETVTLSGFGTFDVTVYGERKGRNPQTNEEIVLPATRTPKLKPSKCFKDWLNS